jgi:hypothetical protein
MRALVAFAALGLGTAVFMPTGISPGKNYLPNPQSKSLRQLAILARGDHWCEWLRVTITDDRATHLLKGCLAANHRLRKHARLRKN